MKNLVESLKFWISIAYLLILPLLAALHLLPESTMAEYVIYSAPVVLGVLYILEAINSLEWEFGTLRDKMILVESRTIKVIAITGILVGTVQSISYVFYGDCYDLNPFYILAFSLLLLPLSYIPLLAISKINIKCPTCIGKGVLSREDIDKLKQEESSELIELIGNYLVIGTCRTCSGRGEVSPDASTLK
jgi:hypothetical protein